MRIPNSKLSTVAEILELALFGINELRYSISVIPGKRSLRELHDEVKLLQEQVKKCQRRATKQAKEQAKD